MSLAEIEAELEKLELEELRELALKSWVVFLRRRSQAGANECSEDNPALLAALDEAVAEADKTTGQGLSAEEALGRLKDWATK